ncbi:MULTISPECIES: cytochrome P450 [unclassified Streptomyces]|uniref:cytochrome P450 n=1 Tax=unclassified Streptomyces TaxID=2593676 RepID=UPI0037FB989A
MGTGTSTSTTAGPRVPGPTGPQLVRSLVELRRSPLVTFRRAQREYGDVVRLAAGLPGLRLKLYLVFSAEGAREVLATQAANFRKENVMYEEIRHSFGNGLLTSQDDEYRRQRRLIQPLFTRRRVDGYADAACTQAESLAERWRDAPDATVDLAEEMPAFALRTLCRVLFGADAEAAVPVMSRCLPVLLDYTLERGNTPLTLPRHWPTPRNRRAAAARRGLYELCDQIIAERRTGGAAAGAGSGAEAGAEGRASHDGTASDDGTAGDDLLGLLTRASGESGDALGFEELRDQILIFLVAGHETTSTGLAMALYLLARHPEVQARAREEVDQVLAGRRPGAADLDALGYLTRVLKEAMRVQSPVPFISRRAVADTVVDGHRIPAGADVMVCGGVTHYHPAYWQDPERFDPERFTPEGEASRPRYTWFPFGGGNRACIGQHFSMLESVLCLAVLLQRYELAPVGPGIPLGDTVTLKENGPIRCRLTPRTSAPPA